MTTAAARDPIARRRRFERPAGCAEITAAVASGTAFSASSISSRTSAISAKRRLRSFSRQRRKTLRIAGGTSAGSADHSGSFVMTNASVSLTSSPRMRASRSASRTARTRTPRCRCAYPPADLSPAPAPCMGPFRERPRPASPAQRHRRRVRNIAEGLGLHRLRQPKVEHLHVPSLPHADVRGFEITMDDPLLVGRLRASAICRATARASVTGSGPDLSRPASVSPRQVPARGTASRSLPRARGSWRCADDSAMQEDAPLVGSGPDVRDRGRIRLRRS